MKLVSFLIVLAMASLSFSIIITQSKEPVAPQLDPIVEAPLKPFKQCIAAVGMIESSSENIHVATPVAGVVQKVFVVAGEDVEEGDPLFLIDHDLLVVRMQREEAAIQVALAKMAAAEARFARATRDVERSSKLVAQHVATREELENRQFAAAAAIAEIEQAEAERKSAVAQVDHTKAEIGKCTVRSPLSAKVLKVNIKTGEYAQAGLLNEPLVLLGKVKPLFIRVDIDEDLIPALRETASAKAFIRGEQRFHSNLKRVRTEPWIVPKRAFSGYGAERLDTRVLQIIYEVTDHGMPLYIGQQMDVFIETSTNVLTADAG